MPRKKSEPRVEILPDGSTIIDTGIHFERRAPLTWDKLTELVAGMKQGKVVDLDSWQLVDPDTPELLMDRLEAIGTHVVNHPDASDFAKRKSRELLRVIRLVRKAGCENISGPRAFMRGFQLGELSQIVQVDLYAAPAARTGKKRASVNRENAKRQKEAAAAEYIAIDEKVREVLVDQQQRGRTPKESAAQAKVRGAFAEKGKKPPSESTFKRAKRVNRSTGKRTD